MHASRRIAGILRTQGVRGLVTKLYVECIDRWFDFVNGTDTCEWMPLEHLNIASEHRAQGTRYEPARVAVLRRFFSRLTGPLPENSVLVDFGAGKGRVLLVAAEFGFREVRGVEFSSQLCDIARRNRDRTRAAAPTRCGFMIIEADAADYAIRADENVFFLFNPFDQSVLDKVLENIATALIHAPRDVFICFYNPHYAAPMRKYPQFTEIHASSCWGYRFCVFSNIEPADTQKALPADGRATRVGAGRASTG
jgi:SAM-dependent methyltransferase